MWESGYAETGGEIRRLVLHDGWAPARSWLVEELECRIGALLDDPGEDDACELAELREAVANLTEGLPEGEETAVRASGLTFWLSPAEDEAEVLAS